MFITESQLEVYKSNPNHRYFEQPMSYIVYSEFEDFMKSLNYKYENIIGLFEHFLHKKLDVNLWEYYFPDGSTMRISKSGIGNDEKYTFCMSTYGIASR